MADIQSEIEAYEKLRCELELSSMGKWVLIREQKLVATFNSFDEAAKEAVRQFGRGPYLIKQVGAPPVTLPASVMFRMDYA